MAAMSLLRQSLYLLFLFLSVSLPSPAVISAHPFLDRERPIRWSRLTPDKLEPDIHCLFLAQINVGCKKSTTVSLRISPCHGLQLFLWHIT